MRARRRDVLDERVRRRDKRRDRKPCEQEEPAYGRDRRRQEREREPDREQPRKQDQLLSRIMGRAQACDEAADKAAGGERGEGEPGERTGAVLLGERGHRNLDYRGGACRVGKKCKMSTEQLADRLINAKQRVPFVQANLIEMEQDDLASVEQFRDRLLQHGVWANKPVPLYPYPGSPDYTKRWGAPDDRAWERALDYYLALYDQFSDIQDQRPLRLQELEISPVVRR